MFRILIDNNDGLGARDHSSNVRHEEGMHVHRTLNRPSRLECSMVLRRDSDIPLIYASVNVVSDTGRNVFSGYVLQPVMRKCNSVGGSIVDDTYVLVAHTPDMLNCANPSSYSVSIFNTSDQQAWNMLLSAYPSFGSSAQVLGGGSRCGRYRINAGSTWESDADTLSSATLSAYRVQENKVLVVPYGQTVHQLVPGTPGLQYKFKVSSDMQVCAAEVIAVGHVEPTAYIHEIFQGDGTTSAFQLSRPRFELDTSRQTHFRDSLDGFTVNSQDWVINDPSSHIALNRFGLTCSGGTGKEAESVVTSRTEIELGGSVKIEASGINIKLGSMGQMVGLYQESVLLQNCFAGFQVASSGDVVAAQAIVKGVLVGTALNLDVDRVYTFRLRFHSLEVQRVSQTYAYREALGMISAGGDVTPAAAKVIVEVQDMSSGGPTNVVTLFSGLLTTTPASCVLGLYNNIDMTCSLAGVQYERVSPADVSLMVQGQGTFEDQTLGLITEGASCHLTSAGALVFYPSYLPPDKALVRVVYRASQRAVARIQSEGSLSAVIKGVTYIAAIEQPGAFSSVDCENAAIALLSSGQGSAPSETLAEVSYLEFGDDTDVWPGDGVVLSAPSNTVYGQGIVKETKLTLQGSEPQGLLVNLAISDERDTKVGLATSKVVPPDTILPLAGIPTTSKLNLNGLVVVGVSSTSIQIDAGVIAPQGGGFEVRYRDETFGSSEDSELVARFSVQVFTLARQAALERYYIRAYDGSTPPVYSAFSVALMINVPL